MITNPPDLRTELQSETVPDREPTMMPGRPITPAVFAQYGRRFFPTPGQIAFLLEYLTISRRIPKGILAELMGVNLDKAEKIKANPDAATRSAVRVLWVLYQIDCRPQCLTELFHWATWGQIDVELPVKRKINGGDLQKVKAILRRFKEQGLYCGLDGVIDMVHKECGIMMVHRQAWLLCKEMDLKYAKPKKGVNVPAAAFGRRFAPQSPYMNMDWRKSNSALGKQFGIKVDTVMRVRGELLALNPKRLADYLMRCGKNPEHFETILLKEEQ